MERVLTAAAAQRENAPNSDKKGLEGNIGCNGQELEAKFDEKMNSARFGFRCEHRVCAKIKILREIETLSSWRLGRRCPWRRQLFPEFHLHHQGCWSFGERVLPFPFRV